jgi:hypothetical protein
VLAAIFSIILIQTALNSSEVVETGNTKCIVPFRVLTVIERSSPFSVTCASVNSGLNEVIADLRVLKLFKSAIVGTAIRF